MSKPQVIAKWWELPGNELTVDAFGFCIHLDCEWLHWRKRVRVSELIAIVTCYLGFLWMLFQLLGWRNLRWLVKMESGQFLGASGGRRRAFVGLVQCARMIMFNQGFYWLLGIIYAVRIFTRWRVTSGSQRQREGKWFSIHETLLPVIPGCILHLSNDTT
jgi:hypothetical protein